jgi:hypothetical protein
MRKLLVTIAGLVLGGSIAHAEPQLTKGIGLSNCGTLAKDLKPSEGLNHMPNALLFYWVQGYMSAANITLLESDEEYIDLALMDEKKLLPLIHDLCKKNPGKKPISFIDKLIDETDKIEGKWKSGTVPWAADEN